MMTDRNARPRDSTADARLNATRPSTQAPPDQKFYDQMISLSNHIYKYQKPGLLDKALEAIDLGQIYSEADEQSEKDSSLGYQDHLIRALLKWFKQDFFTWVNAPKCDQCGAETDGLGSGQPNADELRQGARRVELYRCKANSQHIERFPRYDDPETLLTWRRGRCGEWANCFTLLCIALGSRARWVWNAEDHVWTEVYSNTLGRWVHCDSCENAWDQPKIYCVGWGKKMSYCLGFSISGAQDVTRRYVRDPGQSLPRKLGSEESLKSAIGVINRRCQQGLPKAEVDSIVAEQEAEEKELAGYDENVTPTKVEEEQPRDSGSPEWKRARGEDGKQNES